MYWLVDLHVLISGYLLTQRVGWGGVWLYYVCSSVWALRLGKFGSEELGALAMLRRGDNTSDGTYSSPYLLPKSIIFILDSVGNGLLFASL
jgi:hypothetical protein